MKQGKKKKEPSFFYKNGLSITMLACLFIFWGSQFYTGLQVKNDDLRDHHLPTLSAKEYLTSAHFLEATFENWESEFLQMASYVVLTIFLRQKGSSESKKLGEPEEVDREPKPHPGAPWPVRKGGIWLKIYSNSLSIAFILLFLFSFVMHFYGSYHEFNIEQSEDGRPLQSVWQYLGNSKFWFESFQNWQSEFLAVAAIILLSIWLRQKGSPESKPVDAPYEETE